LYDYNSKEIGATYEIVQFRENFKKLQTDLRHLGVKKQISQTIVQNFKIVMNI